MQEKQETSTLNNPFLSILIPTVIGREDYLNILITTLCGNGNWYNTNSHKNNAHFICYYIPVEFNLEIIICKDNKEMTIGEKRELLYREAQGVYSLQIDDDDDVSPDAIELILEAIKQEPDCITFEEYVNIDGREYKSNHSLSYPGWVGNGEYLLSDGFHFWRTPFFKSVIKTEIARSVPVPRIRWGEDNMWADELQKHLKTEVHIPKQLYLYKHISSPFNERYGIK